MLELKTVFMVAITTSRMIFPGMPAYMPARGVEPPAKVPAARGVTMDLFSTAKADHTARAQVAIPEGLKLTSPVPMLVDLAQMPKPDAKQDAASKFVVKTYWGCGKEVPEGQPRGTMSDATPRPPDVKLPDTSYAYWPDMLAKPLDPDASAAGTYTLKTNYAGNTSLTLDAGRDFLAPIDLIGIHKKADLEKPIGITWKTVPRAVAYLVTATGGSELESVTWASSADPDAATALDARPHTKAQIDDYVQKKILLSAYSVSCAIPAGVFKGSKSVFVNVTAFGPDMVQEKDGIESWVIVRSTAGMPIHGAAYKPVIEDNEK